MNKRFFDKMYFGFPIEQGKGLKITGNDEGGFQ